LAVSIPPFFLSRTSTSIAAAAAVLTRSGPSALHLARPLRAVDSGLIRAAPSPPRRAIASETSPRRAVASEPPPSRPPVDAAAPSVASPSAPPLYSAAR